MIRPYISIFLLPMTIFCCNKLVVNCFHSKQIRSKILLSPYFLYNEYSENDLLRLMVNFGPSIMEYYYDFDLRQCCHLTVSTTTLKKSFDMQSKEQGPVFLVRQILTCHFQQSSTTTKLVTLHLSFLKLPYQTYRLQD